MKAKVNGNDVLVRNVSLRERKFGTHDGTYGQIPYSLEIPISQVVTAFGNYYQEYVDDARRFGGDDPMEQSLKKLGWPEFQELASKHPETLSAFVREVDYDFLQQVFAESSPSESRYFVNSVTDAVVAEDSITLVGNVVDVESTQG